MTEPNAGDVALACVSLLVDELVRGGVSGAAIAPGSRSTPIVLALARHPGVDVHVHLDERSAGFFALGLAKATRRPAVVACTSGTAAANLFPAVVEAAQAGVPLIVLTADRPSEFRGTGANQTIDQSHLYGTYPRLFVEAPLPDAREPDTWRALGALAVRTAAERPRGPVHVNLPFAEPLTPAGAPVDLADETPAPRESAAPATDAAAVERLLEIVKEAENGVVVAGSLSDDAPGVVALAKSLGWPLYAEPTSGLRVPDRALTAGYWLVADAVFAAEHRPGLVLQFGAAPTARAALAFVAGAERLVVITEDRRQADPARHASWRAHGDVDALARGVADRLRAAASSSWGESWRAADGVARAALDRSLDASEEPFEGRVARDLVSHLTDGTTLVVASSMPIRDVDAYAAPRTGLRVLANRGASGIDGFVSTVLGVVASGSRTVALAGDLSMLHDVGGLMWSARRGYDAVFVVVNNGGGGIFDLLPSAALPEHEDLFVTPQAVDLGALAGAAGVSYERVAKASGLLPAVDEAVGRGGVAIVDVAIDRAEAVRRRRACTEMMAEVLAQT